MDESEWVSCKSSVDRFVAENRERVQRGARFSQLTDQEREDIIYRARRLARAGGCPSDVTRRIAEHMNRSVETIRYTLKEYDKKNRELAIFPGHGGPLTEQTKEQIYKQHRRGVSAESIAKKHCRSVNSIYRILGEMRAKRIQELPLGLHAERGVSRPRTGSHHLDGNAGRGEAISQGQGAVGAAALLWRLCTKFRLLTREQEQHIFRKMNYLKYRASELRKSLDLSRP